MQNTFFSVLWNNPRGQWALILAGAGGASFLIGTAGLLQGPTSDATFYLYAGVFVFLAGALLAWVTWRAEAGGARLTHAAPVSRGQIVKIKKDWLSDAYVLRFNFKDAVGRSYRGRKILSQQEAFMWREGEEGGVRYDARNPKVNVWIGRGVALDTEGDSATAPATIIEVTPQHYEDGSDLTVRYRYRDHVGESHEDEFIDDEGAPYRVGDAGTVEFDPQQPELSTWLGKTGVASGHDEAAARSPIPRVTTLTLAPAAKPSTFRLMRHSKPIKNAMLILVYLFIAAVFLIVLMAATDPASPDDQFGVALYAAMFLGLVVWFVWSLWKGMREVSEWRGIIDRGRAAEGTVSLVEEKRQSLGRWTWKPGWVISYRYRDHTGQSHTGASGYLSRKEAQRWRSRDKCAIIYDPAQPWQSVWVGGHDA